MILSGDNKVIKKTFLYRIKKKLLSITSQVFHFQNVVKIQKRLILLHCTINNLIIICYLNLTNTFYLHIFLFYTIRVGQNRLPFLYKMLILFVILFFQTHRLFLGNAVKY